MIYSSYQRSIKITYTGIWSMENANFFQKVQQTRVKTFWSHGHCIPERCINPGLRKQVKTEPEVGISTWMRWIHSNHIRSTLLNYFSLKSHFCSKDIEIRRDTEIECRVELHSESNGTSLTSLQGGSGRSRSGKLPWSNWSECAVWAAWALQHLDAFWIHSGCILAKLLQPQPGPPVPPLSWSVSMSSESVSKRIRNRIETSQVLGTLPCLMHREALILRVKEIKMKLWHVRSTNSLKDMRETQNSNKKKRDSNWKKTF